MTQDIGHTFDAVDGVTDIYNDMTEKVLQQVCDTSQEFMNAGQDNPLESATLAIHLYVQSLWLVISEIKRDAGITPDRERFFAAVREAVERVDRKMANTEGVQTDEV